jgi:hypothetical protein
MNGDSFWIISFCAHFYSFFSALTLCKAHNTVQMPADYVIEIPV